MMFVLLATCAVLVVTAAPAGNTANFSPLLEHGWAGVFAAVPLMVSLFLGIETSVEVGEEVQNGRRNIPLGIALSIVLTAAIYFSVAAAALYVLGSGALAESKAPLLDLANVTLGDDGQPLILLSATVAIGTSLNAISLTFSRSLFAMGRSGALPAILARVHPRFGTPYIATTSVYLLCVAGLFMPSNLVFLFLAVNIPTLLKYAATCFAATRVVTRHPDVYERATFRFSPGAMQAWAWAGIVCALLVAALGWNADWRPYPLLVGWAAAGLVYYLVSARKREVSKKITGGSSRPMTGSAGSLSS
jgi:APA family basic amino acid/polyamine antiporter